MGSILERAEDSLEQRLSPASVSHSKGVSETAAELARNAGADADHAALAGILHDWSREESDEELLAFAREHDLPLCEVDLAVPHLLHARVAARRVAESFPDAEPEVLSAIESHTLGAVPMSALAKIVYVADVIEPGRSFEGVESLRHAVRNVGVDEAFAIAMCRTVDHLVRARKPIHPTTVEVWNEHVAGVTP